MELTKNYHTQNMNLTDQFLKKQMFLIHVLIHFIKSRIIPNMSNK